jgi:nucleotide-binding universal stress UspA family protein
MICENQEEFPGIGADCRSNGGLNRKKSAYHCTVSPILASGKFRRSVCHAGFSNLGGGCLRNIKTTFTEDKMTAKIVIGLDGTDTGERALAFAKDLASRVKDCTLLVIYVIEWSPFTFQTPEENEQRHKRREEEIELANSRIVAPAVEALKKAGFKASGLVRHGDVAETINALAVENGGTQIIVGRASAGGFSKRIFGSSTQNLVMHADLPVTVVG